MQNGYSFGFSDTYRTHESTHEQDEPEGSDNCIWHELSVYQNFICTHTYLGYTFFQRRRG